MSSLTPSLKGRAAQNMGRPPKTAKEKKVTVSVALSPTVLQDLKDAAQADHRSLSSMIESIVSNHVKSSKIVSKKVDGKNRNT